MKHFICFLAAAATLLLAGCSTSETLAEGISGKSLFMSGTVGYSRVGLDEVTQTPELLSLFVWGDYTSVAAGDEVFHMEESKDASIFNSEAITRKKKVFFATGDKNRMDKVIETFAAKEAQDANQGD